MLEKIKGAVFAKYKKEDIFWVFISAFDENNKLLMSNGCFYTDKVLDNILDTLYHGLFEKYKNISYLIVDIVINSQEILDVSKLNEVSLSDFGIAVVAWNKYWVMLPNTQWVTNSIQALQLIKQKDHLEWNVKILKFQTDRIFVQ